MGITQVDGVCADLGVSSPQLDDPARGMSFRREGPLDMRMDPTRGETALEMMERLEEDELADVIYKLGDERRSRRISHSIKRALAAGDLENTLDLRRAIVRATGPVRVGGVDPATRTFQALRIAVNGELDELTSLLEALETVVAPGGIAALLSFHSLEDRIVKQTFKALSGHCSCPPGLPVCGCGAVQRVHLLTRRPVVPTEHEISVNPRARSAKLRVAERIDSSSQGSK